jgi:hypothetical protein
LVVSLDKLPGLSPSVIRDCCKKRTLIACDSCFDCCHVMCKITFNIHWVLVIIKSLLLQIDVSIREVQNPWLFRGWRDLSVANHLVRVPLTTVNVSETKDLKLNHEWLVRQIVYVANNNNKNSNPSPTCLSSIEFRKNVERNWK